MQRTLRHHRIQKYNPTLARSRSSYGYFLGLALASYPSSPYSDRTLCSLLQMTR